MSRRVFLKALTTLIGSFTLPTIVHAIPSQATWKTLQVSPLAGFQYYSGEMLWPNFDVGQSLTLVREADNPFDARAVSITWQGHKLGYIPAIDNAAISQLLDRGESLEATIAELNVSRNPWDRIRVEVRWMV